MNLDPASSASSTPFTAPGERFKSVLTALAIALEAREPQLRRRAELVARLCASLGRQMKLDEASLYTLRCGALIHDIGNIGIPDAILLKPTGLTDWEFQEVKLHPIIGERILQPLEGFAALRPLVRSHHEKLDGSGYPDRLQGDEISLLVRVLSVADVYQTLRSVRAYRSAFSHAQALDILRREVERGWWDGSVVRLLEQIPQPELDAVTMD
jgi:putative two-component system response regulator